MSRAEFAVSVANNLNKLVAQLE